MSLVEMTAAQAIAGMRDGEIAAEEFAAALIERAGALAELNAFIHFDADAALEAARAADKLRASGAELGPLHGLPLALKDNIDTAQFPTTGGTPGLLGNQPKADAPVFARLRAAGAYCFAKANLHELAYGITCNNGAFGPVRNPYDRDRIPGGSSGGTGAAVGARMVPAGLGSDTGGSVRIPAALCGIVGFRPSSGRYDQTGVVPISNTRDTIGPMTRTVEDAALLDGVIANGTTAPASIKLDGLRVGVPRGYFYENIDPETANVMEAALGRLADYGVVLVEADVPDLAAADEAASMPVALYETGPNLDAYLADHGIDLDFAGLAAAAASPDVKGLLESMLGEGAIPEAVYREALDIHRPRLRNILADYFNDNDLRAIVFPTTPLPAALIGEDETVSLNDADVPTFMTFIRNTDPASNAGLPGLSMPAGLTEGGLPVGMEFDGPEGSDGDILAIGRAVEALEAPAPGPSLKT